MVASKAKRSAAAKKAARTRKLNTISQNMFAKDFGKLTKKQKASVRKEFKKVRVKKTTRKKTKRIYREKKINLYSNSFFL